MDEIERLKQKINSKEFDSLGYDEKFSILDSLTKLLLNQNPTESIQYAKTTLLLTKKMEDREKTASTLLKLSKSYFVLSQSSKALQYAFEALKIYEELQSPDDEAKLINNIASIYTNLKDFDKSFHYNNRALKIHKERGNEKGIAGTYINLGICYEGKNDLETAISNYEKGLSVYLHLKDIHKASYAFHNLGNVYRTQGKYQESLEALLQGLTYKKEVEDLFGIAYSLEAIGILYVLMGKDKEAFEYLEEALEHAKKYAFRDVEWKVYGHYSALYTNRKDFENALEYLKKYLALNNQIMEDNKADQIEKLTYLYEMDRKEKEIEERNRHLEELKIINESLESFSYSISHDLRAPLRAIHSFSSILLNDYQDKFEQDALKYLNVIQSNTFKMDQLITDLLSLAKVSRSDITYSEIDMNEVVDSVFEDVASQEIQDKIAFSIENLDPSYGDKNLVRIIWVNLLSNAIKFTLPNSVRFIVIGSYMEHERVVYFIKDSGIGFDEKYTAKLFTAFHRLNNTEGIQGTGIGLAIVKRVMDRLNGQVWVKAAPNEGATFSFSLPLPSKTS